MDSLVAPRPPRLLVVDDDRILLDGLIRLLGRLEPTWELRRAGNGQEALVRLNEESIDIVITDLQMPGMDGVRLLTEIEQSHPRTFRIAHSSHPDVLRMSRSSPSALAHMVLAKPAAAAELVEALRKAVGLVFSEQVAVPA